MTCSIWRLHVFVAFNKSPSSFFPEGHSSAHRDRDVFSELIPRPESWPVVICVEINMEESFSLSGRQLSVVSFLCLQLCL